MRINDVTIDETFAEGFSMRFTRLLVTAHNKKWLNAAINEAIGYGTSVIACDAEAGLEGYAHPDTTPDGRPGAYVLLFAFSTDALQKAVTNRVGQCLMTCPSTAVFNGLTESELAGCDLASFQSNALDMGNQLRYFGDGFQKSKIVGERRFWRVPVMDGEFIVEDTLGVAKGVAGGNFLILGPSQTVCLEAAEAAVDEIASCEGVITPFPGGVVRSGSKVGSKYKGLVASTSHAFCPTLRGRVESELTDDIHCVYEIVIDGIDYESVAAATRSGILAASQHPISRISAGNYGGKLGKHHFALRPLLKESAGRGAK